MAGVLHDIGWHLYCQYRGKVSLVSPGNEDEAGIFHQSDIAVWQRGGS